jgi:AraC-like DNA-binding protein
MNTKELHIKNMVCDRCIKVVKEELTKIGLSVRNIYLGEAEVESDKAIDLDLVRKILNASGFELLEDKKFQIIDKIKSVIISLIHSDKNAVLSVNYSEYIAREVGKDYASLSSLFSSAENITIEKYIILQKIEKVKELLVYDELTLSEISDKMAYSSVAYLSSQFKQITGFTPTEFKKIKSHKRKPLDKLTD